MNKHLKQLIELSELDKAIDDFLPEERRINGALNALLDEQKRSERQIEELEIAIVENRGKIDKNEERLKEQTDRIAASARRSDSVKTEREMKALSLEEGIAKEQVSFINDEIARLEKIEEDDKSKIDALKNRIAEIDGEIGKVKEESADALAELNDKRRVLSDQKEKLVAEIPQKVFGFYEKIRRWAGNRAVVPVKKQACYGCFMKISDKVYSEVVASTEIVTCPNCGCILYVEGEKAA